MTRGTNTKQTAFRLPEELLKRLHAHVARMSRNSAGVTYTLADVVKLALDAGLKQFEAEAKQRKGGSHA